MKKVLYAMAMFSMVAMFAACGGSDKKDGKDGDKKTGKEVNKEAVDDAADFKAEKSFNANTSAASMGEEIGNKVCDCMKMVETDPEKAQECMMEVQKEYEQAVASFGGDEQKMKEFDEAGERATQGCMQ